MQGNNTLELNQATMIEALQYYFDNVLFAQGRSPLVSSIEKTSSSRDYGGDTFSVHVKDDDRPQEEVPPG